MFKIRKYIARISRRFWPSGHNRRARSRTCIGGTAYGPRETDTQRRKTPPHIFHNHTECVLLFLPCAVCCGTGKFNGHSHIFATLILFMIVLRRDCAVCVCISFPHSCRSVWLADRSLCASWSHTWSSLDFFRRRMARLRNWRLGE